MHDGVQGDESAGQGSLRTAFDIGKCESECERKGVVLKPSGAL